MDLAKQLSDIPVPDRAELARRAVELDHADAELQSALAQFTEATEAINAATAAPRLAAQTRNDRSQNVLRPVRLEEVVGQDKVKPMIRRMIDSALANGERLDHTLIVGPAGTGKTTLANVIAEELGADCYQVSAPVSLDTLLELRTSMKDGDVFFIDEIHMQAIGERRGSESITAPEVFLQLLEDGVIATGVGMLPFPDVTVIGATTDPGRLPDPFLDRFPLQPRLEKYDPVDLGRMAVWNADKLGLTISIDAALTFALAARGTPRIVNNYVKNARSLTTTGEVTDEVAREVLTDLNDVTFDGLTRDMREMLLFLYTRGRRESAKGEVTYQASVSSIATAIGLSRDQKAVQLRVEPYLIIKGFVQVGHGGRMLTDLGVERALELFAQEQEELHA